MEDEIFTISKNNIRTHSLRDMAQERLEDLNKISKTYKIIEEYYEIIKELIIAIMYSDGYKTLSHKMLIIYLERNYNEFHKSEIYLLDEIRKLRNNIVYYGLKVEKDFLINHEKEIKSIIKKLFAIINVRKG